MLESIACMVSGCTAIFKLNERLLSIPFGDGYKGNYKSLFLAHVIEGSRQGNEAGEERMKLAGSLIIKEYRCDW